MVLVYLPTVAQTKSSSFVGKYTIHGAIVSWNRCIPKSSTLIGFSWIFHWKHLKTVNFGVPPWLWKSPYGYCFPYEQHHSRLSQVLAVDGARVCTQFLRRIREDIHQVAGIPTPPKKYESIGMTISNWMEKQNMFQTTNQSICCCMEIQLSCQDA